LEVANAVRQRAFQQRRTTPASERLEIKRNRDTALDLLQKYIARRAFIEATMDLDTAIGRARALSAKHTGRLGCRGFDLLHVALALELECEVVLTADRMQGALARAIGLNVTVSADQ
jgi:predicted nucleic acid-binding protein